MAKPTGCSRPASRRSRDSQHRNVLGAHAPEYLKHDFDPDRVAVLPPVDPLEHVSMRPLFRPVERGADIRLAFIGRIDRLKGCRHLVQRRCRLWREHSAGLVHLTVAGDGSGSCSGAGTAADALAGAEPRISVRFTGWLSRDACAALLDESGVLAYPVCWAGTARVRRNRGATSRSTRWPLTASAAFRSGSRTMSPAALAPGDSADQARTRRSHRALRRDGPNGTVACRSPRRRPRWNVTSRRSHPAPRGGLRFGAGPVGELRRNDRADAPHYDSLIAARHDQLRSRRLASRHVRVSADPGRCRRLHVRDGQFAGSTRARDARLVSGC